MSFPACPSNEDWSAFSLGKLSERSVQCLAEHLESCSACRELVGASDDTQDPLMGELRRLSSGEASLAEAMPASAAAALEALCTENPMGGEGPVPARLGKFALQEELGRGTYGRVFRAIDCELQRVVAVKLLRTGRFASADEIDRFLREARSAAQLRHAGIVALHDICQTDDGVPFLVEDFVDGGTLAERLRAGPVIPRQGAQWTLALAEALDYAHGRGVVHRDVNPSNVMIDRAGGPFLMDFGLAKRDAEEACVTVEGQVLGTPAYMSPEQARGESRRVDARTDVYSLGVVLYELLTGERPFRGNRRMVLLQVLEDEPRPPRKLNDRAPRDLETICIKAMAKLPSRRYASAREMAEDLDRYLNGEPIRARPVGPVERLGRWCRRNPAAGSLLLAVAATLAIGLWSLSRLSERLVHATAITSAAMQADVLERVNARYSDMVDRLSRHGVVAAFDYQHVDRAIPVPAKFLTEVGEDISGSKSGMVVRHYSDYPWRVGGPKDAFEVEALERLRRNPDEPVVRFEDYDGRPALRYATARRMQATCLQCHNFHPKSPKKDWKVGDVRGVLEIVRPLDRDVEQTREGLRETFVLLGFVAAGLFGLTILIVWAGGRRNSRLLSAPGAPPSKEMV